MPLTRFSFLRPTVQGSDADQNITSNFSNKYYYYDITADRTFTLTTANISQRDFETDIRNSADSTNSIIIAEGASTSINVNGDLGLVIPPGGIGELKRRGNSTVFDFYGYIEA